MPRNARTKSGSGIYHILICGINRQVLFAEDEDRLKFLDILRQCKENGTFQIYAYCLIGNHIHLVIREDKEPIGDIIKKIGSKYVSWYNIKYTRSGQLFQGRFKSEPIEYNEYLFAVIRFIHQNPVKAALSQDLDYCFSSYNEYLYKSDNLLVDCNYILEKMSLEDFIKYNNTQNCDSFLDIITATPIRVNNETAQKIINKISKTQNITEFQALPPEVQAKNIIKIHSKGVSIRQLCSMTGVSKGIIERLLKKNI